MPGGGAWFHLILTTYGSWLDGDERGFRTRHHREHVEGDYRSPPPKGRYAARRLRSRADLTQEPVCIPIAFRAVLGLALRERLTQDGALVVASAVAARHVHVLARLVDRRARHWTGLAKKHATFAMHALGWTGKLWGVRSKAIPIRSRSHQLNVLQYILDHEREGAVIWRWQQE